MFKNISSPDEFRELVFNGAIPIDVRSQEEYSESKIPNSKTGYDWNNGEFYDKFEDFNPENTYILICRSGNRSMQACMFMASSGFENLYNLEGGISEWQGETE